MAHTEIADPLAFSVGEVTGMRALEVEGIDGHRTAGDVAASMASMLELPTNTPYSLRDNSAARMLVDDRPLGSQVPRAGSQLMVVPKAHLG